jgi:hypothetical protein
MAAPKLKHSDSWAGPAMEYIRRYGVASQPKEKKCTGSDDSPLAAS